MSGRRMVRIASHEAAHFILLATEDPIAAEDARIDLGLQGGAMHFRLTDCDPREKERRRMRIALAGAVNDVEFLGHNIENVELSDDYLRARGIAEYLGIGIAEWAAEWNRVLNVLIARKDTLIDATETWARRWANEV